MSVNQAASEVRIAKAIGYRIIAKKAVRAVLWLMLLALIVYGLIASSMTRYVATNLGTLKIVSTNFPGGQAQTDTVVAVDLAGGYDGSVLNNLLTAVTPHSGVFIAEIVEGPYGTPDWSSYGIERDREDTLSNQYIAKCIDGCDGAEGSFILIRSSQIMGIPVER